MSAKTAPARHRQPISPRQIKAVHAAVRQVGLDDAAYRLRLASYGAKTCKDLSWQQAEELLDSLNGVSKTNSKLKIQNSKLQFADFDGRPGFASGAQCRLLAAMFSQITRVAAEDTEGREKALNSFCKRIAGVEALRMVRGFQVERIIKALEAMGAEHKDKGGKA